MMRQPGCCQRETMVVASYLVPEPQAGLALLLLGHLSCSSAGDARHAWSVLRKDHSELPSLLVSSSREGPSRPDLLLWFPGLMGLGLLYRRSQPRREHRATLSPQLSHDAWFRLPPIQRDPQG